MKLHLFALIPCLSILLVPQLGFSADKNVYTIPKPATQSQPAKQKPKKPMPAYPAQSGDNDPKRFAIGLGFPDVRARTAVAYGLDLEGKFAFEQGIEVYTGRLYWNFCDFGPLKAELGAEGGYGQFNIIGGLNGGGPVYGGFFGLEYPFAHCFCLSVDAGPYRVEASSEGYAYQTTQLVFNTALYIYLF
jgi:hypothetical protein